MPHKALRGVFHHFLQHITEDHSFICLVKQFLISLFRFSTNIFHLLYVFCCVRHPRSQSTSIINFLCIYVSVLNCASVPKRTIPVLLYCDQLLYFSLLSADVTRVNITTFVGYCWNLTNLWCGIGISTTAHDNVITTSTDNASALPVIKPSHAISFTSSEEMT